ncbi:MAG: hypothetical protein MUC67_01995 [Acidobacteria bacterium]|jgi:hypothetical protein|nr:hypothetical protein [Acidobacteriota bacterium]
MRPSAARRPFALVALLGLAFLLALVPALAKEAKHIAQYRTIVMADAGPGVQGAGEMDVTIDKWSTDAERTALLDAFKKGGNLGLYEALQKQDPHGYVSQPGSIGYHIRYARQIKTDSGSKVIVVTDKFVSDVNFDASSEFLKYPVSVAEMVLDAKGSGKGTLISGCRLGFGEDGELKIEVPSNQPPIPMTKIWEVK